MINELTDLLTIMNPMFRSDIDNMLPDDDELAFYEIKSHATVLNKDNPLYDYRRAGKQTILYKDLPMHLKNLEQMLVDEKTRDLSKQHLLAGTYVLIFREMDRKQLAKFLTKVADRVNDKATAIINTYVSQLGGDLKNAKQILLLALRRKLLVTKAQFLLQYFQQILDEQSKPKSTEDEEEINYLKPLLTLLSYRIGKINQHDTELFDFCHRLGLNPKVTFAIYLAEKRRDVHHLLSTHAPHQTYALMGILRLKKLSAEKKFRDNYAITSDDQIRVLLEKRIEHFM